jgi:hypothetical protein
MLGQFEMKIPIDVVPISYPMIEKISNEDSLLIGVMMFFDKRHIKDMSVNGHFRIGLEQSRKKKWEKKPHHLNNDDIVNTNNDDDLDFRNGFFIFIRGGERENKATRALELLNLHSLYKR